MNMEYRNSFLDYLRTNFVNNYDTLAEQFAKYASILEAQNIIHNLTAIKPEDYYEKHFLDSLLLSEVYDFRDEKLVDVGSGAGFPGMVLAIVYPKLDVTLLEPTKKRCEFLRLVVRELGLNNVTVVNDRAENYEAMREAFDIATSRAVATLPILLEISAPLVKDGGSILVMKGKNYLEELEAGRNAIYLLKLEIGKTNNHFLPSDGSMRVNTRLIKKGKTSNKYPRAYAQIKKNPL